jgi:outer membrane protein insertion porin family
MMRSTVSVIALCAAFALTTGAAMAQDEAEQGAAPAPDAVPAPDALPAADVSVPTAAPQTAPAADGRVIQQILVEGGVRVEPNTVISYLSLRPGDAYDPAQADMSIETLFATGLFSDVDIQLRDDNVLVVRIEEAPIVNRVIFEGNQAMDNEDLEEEVEMDARSVYSEGRVQADAQRIVELYRRQGRFAATVRPTIVELEQNRVDVIFEISEGEVTGVRRINFIGNRAFSDGRLRRVIATEESRFWRFFSSNTNYDPDRLDYDRELLREFYADNGYAEFRVSSAVAELTPDQEGFYITYTIEEGEQFRYGDITVDTELDELDADLMRALIPLQSGDDYVGSDVTNTVDLLTFAAGTAGYAFVEISPQERPNTEDNTVDINFNISEGPRVYVERIDILGNTQTVDRVIRREMQVVEGDSFNQVLLDRSRNRIRALDFFEEVEIEQQEGTRPDTALVTVNVTEKSTGELSFGAGYSSVDNFLLDMSITQRNLRGRGQYLRLEASTSSRTNQINLQFTEPRFLDRNLAAGVDLFHVERDWSNEAGFQNTSTGAGLRTAFPIADSVNFGLRYTARNDSVQAFQGASSQIIASSGDFFTSLVGYTVNVDRRNDPISPTRGFDLTFQQDFAGVGGDVQYVRTELEGAVYRGIIGPVVGQFVFNAGYIEGWGGDDVRLQDRYFMGGYTFRGFKTAGIGPRVVRETVNEDGSVTVERFDSLGGKAYAIGSFELRFPLPLPEQYGVSGGLFTEFGTLGGLDASAKAIDPESAALGVMVRDDWGLRASAGVTVFWESPFGPVRFDFSRVLKKQDYDRTESFRFSQSTRF